MRRKAALMFIGFIFIFLLLRLYHLTESLNFGSDQGLHLLDIYELFRTGKISLIGPPSSFVVNGRSFFTGPAPYWILLPVLAFFRWDPLTVTYFLIALQTIAVFTAAVVIRSQNPLKPVWIYFLVLCTFFPLFIEHSRYLWHPNFLIPIGFLILALLLPLGKSRRPVLIIWVIGFLLGLGMQYHYSFILAGIVSVVWIAAKPVVNRTPIKSAGMLLSGFVIGFAPIILFELRHNFYNLRTISDYLLTSYAEGSNGMSMTIYYYSFPLLPFLFYWVSLLLYRISMRSRTVVLLALSVCIIYGVSYILPIPTHGYTMVSGWNYEGVIKTANIIELDNPEQYNVVDVLTGDTRALALRYLLTIRGNPPMGVTQYPDAQLIYVYTKVPIDEILHGSLWELDGVKPVEVTQIWDIQNGIRLYRLENKEAL